MVSELEGSVGRGIRIVVEGVRFGFSSGNPFALSILAYMKSINNIRNGIISVDQIS